jgi:hypothetical protein
MRVPLVAAAVLIGTAVLAASASTAPWRPAQTLSPAGETGDQAAVAVAPDGTAVVAWVRPGSTGGGLRIERIAPDGTPSGSPVLLFPGDFISGVRAGIADDGTATVVWNRQRGSGIDPIESVRVSSTGQVGLPRAITPEAEDASSPSFAVAGDGSAVIAWQRTSDRDILARRLAPSGALGDVQLIEADAPGFTSDSLRAAIGAQGAVVVWTTTGFETRGARLTPSGGIAVAAKSLASSAVEPQVGVADDGTATLAYRDFSSGSNRIATRRFFADGGLGQPRDLSFAGDDVRAGEAWAEAAYLGGRPEQALVQLNNLKKRGNLDYYARSRIDARIAAITPAVLELRRQGVRDEEATGRLGPAALPRAGAFPR